MTGEPIQSHEGEGSDVLTSSCTPIIVVPGVMGSRLRLGASRTWDPDSKLSMFRWVALTTGATQTNRHAFSVSQTPSSFVDSLDGSAGAAILSNDLLNKIAQRQVGPAPPAPSGEGPGLGPWNLYVEALMGFFGQTRNWSTVAWGYYGPLLMALEGAFNSAMTACPVYAFGYDWRQSNATSGDLFKTFVDATLRNHPTATQCLVVTHSMGGFVVRAALATNSGLASKIRGVVHTVHPSTGATVAYSRFFSGVAAPVEPIGTFDIPATILATILGQTAAEYAYNMSGLPGPLQLLPSQVYPSLDGGGQWLGGLGPGQDLGAVYSVYGSNGAGGLVQPVSFAQTKWGTDDERATHDVASSFDTHLEEARVFHVETLGKATRVGYHRDTAVLYSTGLPTVYSMRLNADDEPIHPSKHFTTTDDHGATVVTDEWTKVATARRPSGDGTVPDVSARCPGATNAERETFSGLAHSEVFANDTFNRRVIFHLKRMQQGAAT
jgi:hypothetical protein